MLRGLVRKHYRLMLTLLTGVFMYAVYVGTNYFNQFRQSYLSDFGFGFESGLPLVPAFVLIYFMVYFVYLTPFFFVFNLDKYKRTLAAYSFVVLVSALIFLLLPTKMIWGGFVVRGGLDYLLLLLRSVDYPHNLFPSLHVSLAYLATFVVASENRMWGYFLAVASTLIAFSTLLVKQHYVIDLLAGFLLGLFAYVMFVKNDKV